MQPTPPAPAPGAPAPEPVTELIRAQRQNVGYALLIASAVFLALTGWLALKTSKIAPAADTQNKEKDKENPLSALPLDGSSVAQPNRIDYIIGAIGAFAVCATLGGVGAYQLAGRPKPTPDEQRTEARVVLLVLGAAVGAALLFTGALYFYHWSESLTKALDKADWGELKWSVGPLMVVVLGGALMFFSALPARAEERNNPAVRRFIYGSNFGLTVLLLLVLLVTANVLIALRVPNKLDVTTAGTYTLNPQTKQLVESLEQPIHAYAILQDTGDMVTEDTKRLLENCQNTNPSKFQVTVLSPALNKAEITKLRTDYPLAELSREGVLLVAGAEGGADRNRHTFIRSDELEETKADAEGRQVPSFNGEPRLLRELMFLAESKQKPKIYFTQSSGELALAADGRGDKRRSASALKAYLEKNYFEVVPLTFDLGGPAKVPDDATAVVVADPTAPLPANGAEALRKYMTDPRPGGGKGKLVVLAGAQAGVDRKPLVTGLEPVLQPFGVRLSDRFVYGEPLPQLGDLDRAGGTRVTLAMVTQEAADARNPVALGFNKVDRLPLLDCRELISAPAGTVQAVTVLVSQPGRLTWTEPRLASNPMAAWAALNERAGAISDGPGGADEKRQALAKFLAEVQLSRSHRDLAVFVSEGPTARVAVIGCGWFVSDDAAATANDRFGNRGATVWLDLMGSTLDWVRDRPAVIGPTDKPYTTYTLKPGFDSLRMVWVPLGLALVSVLGLGAGVWVIRRK